MLESEPKIWRLPPTAQAAGLARQYLGDFVTELDAGVLGVAQLLITELVTNALRHGSGPVTMTAVKGACGLRISVRDDEERLPRKRSLDVHDLGGRGLQIVDALAAAWGVTTVPVSKSGKTVWCELTSPSQQPPPS